VLATLIHRDSPHRWRWALVSGVALGLAALTRANVLLLAIALGVLVWTDRPRWSRRALRAPLALLAATLVTVTPWLIRDAITFHQFVPLTTEGGFALVGEYNKYAAARTDYPAEWIPPILQIGELGPNAKTMNEAQLDTRLTSMALDYMKAHPGYVAKAVLWNAIRMFNLSGTKFELSIADSEVYPRWLASLSVYTFWALALLAIAGAFTPAARRAPRGFWWCPALLLLASVFIIGSTRYRSPADPFFLILAALALTDGWRRLRGRRSPVPSTAA
jgi:4-amino-4-deoxy-L-arabinose transferase-like glycosyltransferase